MSDRFTDRLSEYLDGELSPADARLVERHLESCPPCASALDELKAVVARAAALEERAPADDLWPGIAERIAEAEPPAVVPIRKRRIALSIPQLAAAGVALAALSGAAAWLASGTASGRTGGPVADVGSAGAGTTGAALVSAGAEPTAAERYAHAIQQLEAALFDTASPLSPATAAKIRRSLVTIDRAIEDARQALEEAPGDPYVRQHLAATMRQKADFLRQTVRQVTQG